MTPIEYLDLLAHQIRIEIAGYRHDQPAPGKLYTLAHNIETSAAYFRAQDPNLPPRKKYPNPESYYAQ